MHVTAVAFAGVTGQQRLGGLGRARAVQAGLGSRGLGVRQVSFDQHGPQPQLPGIVEFVIPAVADEAARARSHATITDAATGT